MKKVGDIIKIKARGRLDRVDNDGSLSFVLDEFQETTEAEKVRLAEKDGALSDDDLAFVFGMGVSTIS